MFKVFGAILIIAGSGGFGLLFAYTHKCELRTLDSLLRILEWMINDLRFRLTPLPTLCRMASNLGDSTLRPFFLKMEKKLNTHDSPDAYSCACGILDSTGNISTETKELLRQLGRSLGQFDTEGQIKCLESVREIANDRKKRMSSDMPQHLRSYQTLALCAGAALAIILV